MTSTHFCLSASLMPGGATTPRQLVNARSTPCSLRVLTSGSELSRFSPVVARTRTAPDLIWSTYSPVPEVAKPTLLPRMAGSRSPPPSYETKLTVLASIPTACASCMGSRWSGPPGFEPPPTAIFGLAFHAFTRSEMLWYGESLDTMMPLGSSMSRAMGVVPESFAADLFVYVAPTTPRPIIMLRSPLPFSFTSLARPTVPPAPERLKTSTPFAIFASSRTFAPVRAVTSYPPPGELGTIIRRPDTALPSLPAAAAPDSVLVAPQAEAVRTASAATATLRGLVRMETSSHRGCNAGGSEASLLDGDRPVTLWWTTVIELIVVTLA